MRPRPGATQILQLQLGNYSIYATARTGAAFVVIFCHTCT